MDTETERRRDAGGLGLLAGGALLALGAVLAVLDGGWPPAASWGFVVLGGLVAGAAGRARRRVVTR